MGSGSHALFPGCMCTSANYDSATGMMEQQPEIIALALELVYDLHVSAKNVLRFGYKDMQCLCWEEGRKHHFRRALTEDALPVT